MRSSKCWACVLLTLLNVGYWWYKVTDTNLKTWEINLSYDYVSDIHVNQGQ